ncbi:MAG: hypothetical protein M1812_004028 [Candelaria pacifica]|nr:MAG: hypothetical protein M1812_004028 [Candelaria pacifica]
MALGIPKLFLKHLILQYGAAGIWGPLDGWWTVGWDYEIHHGWETQMDLRCLWDETGGYYAVWFYNRSGWGGDIIKAFNKALSLPEGTPLELDWAAQDPDDQPTAVYSRASYWNKLGEWYDHQTDRWYPRPFYGDWTDFDIDLPCLLSELSFWEPQPVRVDDW